MSESGWIGVDLDGTLAEYHGGGGIDSIGPPIPLMLARVKRWLANGKHIRIVTARVSTVHPAASVVLQRWMVEDWCLTHLGRKLPVTACKDLYMTELWDDRAVRVKTNTGEIDADFETYQ